MRPSTAASSRNDEDSDDWSVAAPIPAAAPASPAAPATTVRPADAGGGVSQFNAFWALLDAVVAALEALLQALWGPAPLPCASAGVYLLNAIDAAASAGHWLGAEKRWYNRTGTPVLPRTRERKGVVKWLSDRLDPWL